MRSHCAANRAYGKICGFRTRIKTDGKRRRESLRVAVIRREFMLSFLDGVIEYIEDNLVALNVGGVGYELYTTYSALQKNAGVKGTVRFYTYLQAKEDGVTLFGFASKEEKAMFLKLVTVSGVGAKTAVAILSSMRLEELALSIVTGNAGALSKVKGIGKKTAERIILELKEKLGGLDSGENTMISESISYAENDAVDALMALGLTRGECVKAVNAALNAGKSDTAEIIAYALKTLG